MLHRACDMQSRSGIFRRQQLYKTRQRPFRRIVTHIEQHKTGGMGQSVRLNRLSQSPSDRRGQLGIKASIETAHGVVPSIQGLDQERDPIRAHLAERGEGRRLRVCGAARAKNSVQPTLRRATRVAGRPRPMKCQDQCGKQKGRADSEGPPPAPVLPVLVPC